MDCNKEEAVRAKEIAEQRLTQEDYVGAQKMALKAEQLFPQLENLSQLLTVCEIHCSAQLKINGLHDWYKILQVAPESDENLIRRQFRKFALLLHPDKNKLPGAEAAFKLVGEAHKTLSDRYSRSMYDIKRLQIVRPAGPHQSKNNNGSSSHNSSFTNFNSSNQPRPQQQPQQSQPQPQPQPQHGVTFWTICTNCKTHHQYNRNIISKTVRCVLCSRNFTANVAPPPNPVHIPGARNQPQHFSGQPQAQAQAQKSGVRGTTSNSTAWIGKKPESNNPNPKPIATNSSGLNGVVGQRSKRVSADTSKSDAAAAAAAASSNPNTNPGNEINPQHDADIRHDDDKKQTDSAPNAADADGSTPRRSARFKRDVNNSNDIEAGKSSAAKKARVEVNSKGNGYSHADATNVNNTSVKNNSVKKDMREKSNQKGKEKVEPSGLDDNAASQAAPNSHKNTQINAAAGRSESSDTKYVYPDPEFCDFDKLKDIKKFAVNQIWALYDNLDAMPRFYGRIRDVSSTESGFKVKYTWLEHKPVNETEAAWLDEELPVGCGNYTLGETETTDDRLIFSHMILDEKEKKKGGPYVIFPRKGEVWAVFKNWDIKWSQKTKRNKKYEYEVVEVLSDFSRINGIRVVPLVKVEGFVSVFARIQNWVPTHIPHGEMLRFSHSIPSFRLSGSERDDLPEGSLELDTVALPTNFATAFPSVCINSVNTQTQCHDKNDRDESERCESPHPSIDSVYQIPDSDFHNFDLYRTCDLFQRGQIWAVYSDLDTYPKYYGYIRKVDPDPFKVLVSWLEADPTSEVEREWLNATLPVSCGKFKVSNRNMTFSEGTFSHMVSTKQYRGKYEILPQVGEIWAVYKNWSAKWTLDDLDKCEYDIVEIKEQKEGSILVWPLRQVTGYTAVFMPERVGEIGSAKLEIHADEYIIFSHRIPAVGLTEERGGKLRGYWELDPASVPDQFLYRDN